MLTKTDKRVKLKNKATPVIREQYLRDDISCHSPLCDICTSINTESKLLSLDKEATHYAIPCADVIISYLELFESAEIKGLIILQSIASRIQNQGQRSYNRLLKISKDIRRGWTVFLNEIHRETHVERSFSESYDDWLIKSSISTANFYASHLKNLIPIILVTEKPEAYKSLLKHDDAKVYTLKEYLSCMYKDLESVHLLYESISLALSEGCVNDQSSSYEPYLPLNVLEAGVKAGRYHKGYLRVNKHNASQEAFVTSSKAVSKESGDILICGMLDRNRAVHGDEVVVQMLPQTQWKSRSLKLKDDAHDAKDDSHDSVCDITLPTGKVIGVIERRWRNYVATLPEENEDSNTSAKGKERLLVVPYDYRIPKIRVLTKQAETLRNQRILVRIDHWEKDSQYPNGHFVQALGEIGMIETEIKTLLIEHELSVGEFPQNIVAELPTDTDENPWTLAESEIAKRKDLRDSHLIFSIDPKGCEDVDDTLSVRELADGNLELGVHIADVTHFVQPLSLVDQEAQSRSTSVYLPDRRFDMLPHVLSGNLCSLLGNLDRYAVSVLWILDQNCKVQDVWYGRTIIRSKYKLCYEAAQEILFGATATQMVPEIPELQGLSDSQLNSSFEELKSAVSKLYYIANVIRRERLNTGGLELSSINMKFEIDRNLPSVVTDVKSKKELAIHKTVAECMIFANHWVAKKINESFPRHAVLRRHPHPRETDLAELQKLASTKGFVLNIHSNKELATSLEQAMDHTDPAINQIFRILTTQTMNQATYCCTGCYSASEFYHYGLGLDQYTHFTSPIRRYADILVHRQLLAAVEGPNEDLKNDADGIEELCTHMNAKHKAAQDIEKDAQQLFLAYFFGDLSTKNSEDKVYVDAVIYSLRTNGVLVFVPKYGIKGAVHLCNKDGKVAFAGETTEWVEGKVVQDETCLVVEAFSQTQKYHIFDHLTVNIKVERSRAHQDRIVFDLIKKEPYLSDWDNAHLDEPNLIVPQNSNDAEEITIETAPISKEKEFNLYALLEKFRAQTLIPVEN